MIWLSTVCLLSTLCCATVTHQQKSTQPAANLPEPRLVDETLKCTELQQPERVSQIAPRYPKDILGGASAQGEIVVEAIVTIEGTVRDPKVLRGDNPSLIDPVLIAVKQWRYKPAMCDGTPVEMVFYMYTRFWIP